METNNVFEKFARIVKPTTATSYMHALKIFCNSIGTDPHELLKMDLEEIENKTEDFILDQRKKYAPKYLNVIFCSIKTWLFVNRIIKNRRLFREIKFDKSSLKTSALMSESLDTEDMKKIFSLSNGEDSVTVALGSLLALRPALIPQIRVKFIHPKFRKIIVENDKVRIELKKPTLMIIPRETETGDYMIGNKANIDFIVFIPTRIGEKLELNLNIRNLKTEGEMLNEKLTTLDNKRDYTYVIKKYFKLIGKGELPTYRLRNYGDFLLDRIKDKDLKEQLMGHKGEISAVYGFRGLSDEKIAEFLKMYSVVDRFIDESIFGSLSDTDRKIAVAQTVLAQTLGVSQDKIDEIMKVLDLGKMSLEQFNAEISKAINESYNIKLKEQVQQYVKEVMGK